MVKMVSFKCISHRGCCSLLSEALYLAEGGAAQVPSPLPELWEGRLGSHREDSQALDWHSGPTEAAGSGRGSTASHCRAL